MIDCRLQFRKEGKAVYISHLDLVRTMQRAFARAGLHVKHTEGFNPKPHMVFSLPLSVGASSECELVDLKLLDEIDPKTVAGRLVDTLPAGIVPVSSWTPQHKLKELAFLEADCTLFYKEPVAQDTLNAISGLFEQKEILIEKKGKKGIGLVDIRPRIQWVKLTPDGSALHMLCRVQAQEPGLNPALMIRAIEKYLPAYSPLSSRIHRTRLLDAEGSLFR